MKKTLAVVLVTLSIGFAGCKGSEEMKTQIADLTSKNAESEKKLTSIETELKKTAFEVEQMKGIVSKLSDVVLNMQKAKEIHASAPAKKASTAAKKAPAKHAAPSKHAKKHH